MRLLNSFYIAASGQRWRNGRILVAFVIYYFYFRRPIHKRVVFLVSTHDKLGEHSERCLSAAMVDSHVRVHVLLGCSVANFISFLALKIFLQSVKIWQTYSEFKGGNFFETRCILLILHVYYRGLSGSCQLHTATLLMRFCWLFVTVVLQGVRIFWSYHGEATELQRGSCQLRTGLEVWQQEQSKHRQVLLYLYSK